MPTLKIYNYRTEQWGPMVEGAEADYIPQHPIVQNLYRHYLDMGDAPLLAVTKVLEAYLANEKR